MDFVPVAFIVFKVLVFGAAMFFAVKWHYDQGKHTKAPRAVLRTGVALAAVFIAAAAGLVFATFAFARWMGLDMNLP
ncbi:hypothetical protein [Rhodoferax sp.]|uniref:hypothetical protein n=1 Tax=Rhodoferax sp. TaxID=50421 RepID=UPI0025FCE8F6|nr:hypothetical protein [Rhodoferax sp.]